MNQGRTIKGVVVDAGHGGTDPGAVAGNLKEKDFDLRAAQYMYQRLRELGIPAVMTRSGDETITREERVNTMVNSFGNTKDVLVLANHVNAGGGQGGEVYYALRDNGDLARLILQEWERIGRQTRGAFQRRLPEDPTKDYYYIHRLTPDTTSLLLEYGYIDNPSDAEKLQTNLLNYVEAVIRAVAQYANVPYSPPGGGNISGNNTYTVQAGDSLWSIANRFGTTVNDLINANNLTSDLLRIGQVLVIPSSNITGNITYTVQRGDTLYNLAQRYNTTVNDLINANNLTSDMLLIGQVLTIPSNQTTLPPQPTLYIVVPGDTLWKIAGQFNTTINELRTLNNLTTDVLQIGQQLMVPNNESNISPTTYVVQRGDSLYQIANRFNVTISDLIALNNLTSDILQIGQVLRIPV